jgi:hypothetical protein
MQNLDWNIVWAAIAAIIAVLTFLFSGMNGKGRALLRGLRRITRRSVKVDEITLITPKDGKGIGYNIVIHNLSDRELIIKGVRLSGETRSSLHGFTGFKHEVLYRVEFERSYSVSTSNDSIEWIAKAYDSESQDWGTVGNGRYFRKLDTSVSEEVCKYEVNIPTTALIPAQTRTLFRITFKHRKSNLIGGRSAGQFIMATIMRIGAIHELRLLLSPGHDVVYEIGEEFFNFITNPEYESS